MRGGKGDGSTGQNGINTHATKKRGCSQCHKQNYCLSHLTMLRRHERIPKELPKCWEWNVALGLFFFSSFFFPFYFFYLLFFVYIFFFAKIPKAGQTHRKQATGTATKHSSAVKMLKLTTVRTFAITFQSFL